MTCRTDRNNRRRRSTRLQSKGINSNRSSRHLRSNSHLTKATKSPLLPSSRLARTSTTRTPKKPQKVKRKSQEQEKKSGNRLLFDTSLHPFENLDGDSGYTFGLELEFIIIFSLDDIFPRLPKHLQGYDRDALRKELHKSTELGGHDHIIREAVQEVLKAAGLTVNSARSNHESIQQWSVEPEPAIKSKDERNANRDSAVVGIEIKSGALDFSAASLALVAKGIELIRSNFNITYNESCGLHVHVGVIDQATGLQHKFELAMCQSLTVLHLLFEDEINRLYPHHVLFGHKWPQLFRARLWQTQGLGAVEAAKATLDSQTWNDFFRLLSTGKDDRNLAVNFQNLEFENTFQTIEFRQHESCFDIEQILRRIQLCIAMTHWARGPTKQNLEKHIWAVENRFALDVVHLLRNLGVPSEVVEFYQRRLYDHTTSAVSPKNESDKSALAKPPPNSTARKPRLCREQGHSTSLRSETGPGAHKSVESANTKAMSSLRTLGSSLSLGEGSARSKILFKVGDKDSIHVEPVWVEEADALAMTSLKSKDLKVLKRTRARRWGGKSKETIRKRWPWSK